MRDLAPVALVRDHLRKATWCFQRARAGCEAVFGHQRAHQASACCTARVKRLGHGAKLLAQANRLARCQPQSHLRLMRVELEQACTACGCTQHAGGARDVPATVVVVGVHHVANTAGDVYANHQRINYFTPGVAIDFSQRQQR